jgi:hypothetical protein
MATNSNKETWVYAPEPTDHYNEHVGKLPETLPNNPDNRQHVGRLQKDVQRYIKERMETGQKPNDPRDKIFRTAPPVGNLTADDKIRAGKFARATLKTNSDDINNKTDRLKVMNLGSNFKNYKTDGSSVDTSNVDITEYHQGYLKSGETSTVQKGHVQDDGSAQNVIGPVFYDDNTEHFEGKNPYRVTTDVVDKFVTDTASKLVGIIPGEVLRDLNTDEITRAIPRSSEKRRETQRTLSNLSRSLLTTYDNLNLNPTQFRNVNQDTINNLNDIHTADHATYNVALKNYNAIAQDLSYLNTDDNTQKWSGTPKYDKDGGITYDIAGGNTKQLFNPGTDDTELYPDDIMNMDSDQSSPFYFKPELSNYKIKVADKKSAVALAHTLRQFFDLQVLYYKKHMEILQVFQLLVIFFEKYNYSINSLMYILEHLVKDKIKPKEGDPIEVAIPIDFTKSIIGMLKDQKQMMNVVAGFKAHLGMQDGGLKRDSNIVIMPDDNIFLDNRHHGVYATSISRINGTYDIYSGPDATWYPTFYAGRHPIRDTIMYLSDATGPFFNQIINSSPPPGGTRGRGVTQQLLPVAAVTPPPVAAAPQGGQQPPRRGTVQSQVAAPPTAGGTRSYSNITLAKFNPSTDADHFKNEQTFDLHIQKLKINSTKSKEDIRKEELNNMTDKQAEALFNEIDKIIKTNGSFHINTEPGISKDVYNKVREMTRNKLPELMKL